MKLKVGKLILLPIVAIPTMFFAFGFSKFTTYRSIVLEDLRVNEKYTYKDDANLTSGEQLTVSRAYIFKKGALSFNVKEDYRTFAPVNEIIKFEEGDSVSFRPTDVPFIWLNHRFISLQEAYDRHTYSRDDIIKIHTMCYNNENDFSIMDQMYLLNKPSID